MELSQQLEDKQVNVQHMQSQSDTLDGDIERLFEIKQKVSHQSLAFLHLVSQLINSILASCRKILIEKQLIKNYTAFNRAGTIEQ